MLASLKRVSVCIFNSLQHNGFAKKHFYCKYFLSLKVPKKVYCKPKSSVFTMLISLYEILVSC